MESVLRPRDIQARIRSGESPESVAAAAQTSLDWIMNYATPVLAERAYVAQQAQKASVRRRAGDGPVGHLGDAVAHRLSEGDLDPEAVEWDAWRRDDGKWTLVADYAAPEGTRRARFVYDVAGRYVVADDDESRRLVGERAPGRGPAAEPGADPAPAVSEQVPLGDDAIALVTGRPVPEPSGASASPTPRHDDHLDEADPTTDLTEPARRIRAVPTGGPDWMSTQASERPAAAAAPEPAPAPTPAPTPAPAPARTAPAPEPQDALFEVPSEPAADSEPPEAEPAEPADRSEPAPKPKKPAKGRGRASVPSWDEIMFGSAKGE